MDVTTFPITEIQIKLTGAEAEQLVVIAARRGVTTPELVRCAIEEFLTLVVARESADDADWQTLGLSTFEAEWDNPEDAIYDNWREIYGVGTG